MDFDELLRQILHLLQWDKRISYRALKRRSLILDSRGVRFEDSVH